MLTTLLADSHSFPSTKAFEEIPYHEHIDLLSRVPNPARGGKVTSEQVTPPISQTLSPGILHSMLVADRHSQELIKPCPVIDPDEETMGQSALRTIRNNFITIMLLMKFAQSRLID
jgi:hypothetical protein